MANTPAQTIKALAARYRTMPNGGALLTVAPNGTIGNGYTAITQFPNAAAAGRSLRAAGFTKSGGYWKLKQGKRANPANPSDSVLKGATVLGSVRNSKGQVTGLRVRLRPGAGGTGSAVKRTNPTGARKSKWYSAGKRAAQSGKYANKRDAWDMGRAKPTGAAGVAAQAAFFDGWRDAGYRTNPPILKLPLSAMKYERERERYPNGVSISAERISGRSYGYTVHYDTWRTKLFTSPGAARKFAESQSKK